MADRLDDRGALEPPRVDGPLEGPRDVDPARLVLARLDEFELFI